MSSDTQDVCQTKETMSTKNEKSDDVRDEDESCIVKTASEVGTCVKSLDECYSDYIKDVAAVLSGDTSKMASVVIDVIQYLKRDIDDMPIQKGVDELVRRGANLMSPLLFGMKDIKNQEKKEATTERSFLSERLQDYIAPTMIVIGVATSNMSNPVAACVHATCIENVTHGGFRSFFLGVMLLLNMEYSYILSLLTTVLAIRLSHFASGLSL
jgi:hypothetical protein